MANGSGLAIAGIIIGIVVATQVSDFESADSDLPDASSTSDDNADSTLDEDDDPTQQDPTQQEVPTRIDAGIPGVEVAGAVTSVEGSAKVVALTFSSGPDPGNTPQILDVLGRHGVPATFCMTGEQARDYPELVRRISDEGHTLCSQGLSQDPQLAGRDDAQIRAEIEGARAAIQAAVPGVAVPYFRAPAGEFSAEVNEIAEAYEHTPLGWSVDPRDWAQPGPAAIVDAVLESARPGAIVVLHDGGGNRSDTVAALDMLITDLQTEGYQIVVP
ncbi:MAG TPA: polysaccharide deacetylase family protein [Jiangellaceae bacterium]|nr:polysaccharide deacetylase family protein [Jiangellaceae bacterium]